MTEPNDRSVRQPSAVEVENEVLSDDDEKQSTRDIILDAAIAILGRDGYQGLTARKVAAEAGTNLALVNYYFGGKRGLLLAVYDALERQRFERQSGMYDTPDEPLSAKWRRAVDFYRQDLADGFVRIHHELLVQGISDPQLGERARQRIRNWGALLTAVAEEHQEVLGLRLPPPVLIAVFAAFWYGMEEQHLIGMPEEEVPYFEILEMIGNWIEEQEQGENSS
ncbi:MAG: TetR/AcrR family transcriptional regulator [Chloroflexota bacterium]